MSRFESMTRPTLYGSADRPNERNIRMKNTLLLFLPVKIAFNKVIDIPIHHRLDIPGTVVRAVILYESIRLEDIASNLVSPCDVLLGDRILLLLLIVLVKLTPEHLECHLLVHELASFVLALDDYACRIVCDSYSTVGFVDMLSTSTSGAVCIETVVLRFYIYLYRIINLCRAVYA